MNDSTLVLVFTSASDAATVVNQLDTDHHYSVPQVSASHTEIGIDNCEQKVDVDELRRKLRKVILKCTTICQTYLFIISFLMVLQYLN
jgi:hypothetical protein